MSDSTFGERVAARRIELCLSQEEVATKMGYKSRSSINKIEMDKADLPQKKIAQLAQILQTSPSYLLGIQQTKETANFHARILRDQKVLDMIAEFYSLNEEMQETIIDFVHLSYQRTLSEKID